jgi:hypothetical protein
MAIQQAVARRLGLPATPGTPTYADALDPLKGIDPRLARLKMLPRPVNKGIAGIKLPMGM